MPAFIPISPLPSFFKLLNLSPLCCFLSFTFFEPLNLLTHVFFISQPHPLLKPSLQVFLNVSETPLTKSTPFLIILDPHLQWVVGVICTGFSCSFPRESQSLQLDFDPQFAKLHNKIFHELKGVKCQRQVKYCIAQISHVGSVINCLFYTLHTLCFCSV